MKYFCIPFIITSILIICMIIKILKTEIKNIAVLEIIFVCFKKISDKINNRLELAPKFLNMLALIVITSWLTVLILCLILIPDIESYNFNYIKDSGIFQCSLLIIFSYLIKHIYNFFSKFNTYENALLTEEEKVLIIEASVILGGIIYYSCLKTNAEEGKMIIFTIISLIAGKHIWIDFSFRFSFKNFSFKLVLKKIKENRIIIYALLVVLFLSISFQYLGINLHFIALGISIPYLIFVTIYIILGKKLRKNE
ncbi:MULTISPECIES: hypothetical protein [unclassified Clostridioides]|uniref:hypothetical protein n=1 Tax=unclassified Clostridioides TaxID=2635829 RepID=UPI001D11FB44|nr:hypothetical protein [Clostridioides sp. ES-S-0049-03]MCC0678475.1 hypothetical protein [Clostridioides sp. ES-W-0018-02]MCC0713318.1 hypothetical protein [Clostridioides sp. ES-W-0017-02]